MMERALEINPTNTSLRFDLAYLHSHNEHNSLAMYHYEKIPRNERGGSAWNNLGVVYQNLRMPATSVSAYKSAAEKKETLAMSNLANLLMNAGFISEATEMIEKAQKSEVVHDNVINSLARLKEIHSEENNTRTEELIGIDSRSEFLSTVGRFVWRSMPTNYPIRIAEDRCDLDVEISDGIFTAIGFYEKDVDNAALFGALSGSSSKTEREKYRVEYRGSFVGRVFIGEKSEGKINEDKNYNSLLNIPAKMDLSRFCAAPGARLGHLSFESDRAFPAQC